MRVLVMRPQAEAERTREDLARAGHEVVVSPLFRIEPTGNALPPGPFDSVVAASANAFRFLPDGAAASLAGLPVYLVGERTAEAARTAGFLLIRGVAPTAEALVGMALVELRGKRVLYVAGAERKPLIERGLSGSVAELALAEIYRTAPAAGFSPQAREALRSGALDAVLHFSRRSAEFFVSLVASEGLEAEARALPHFCLSADVALGLCDLAALRISWPERPRADDLIALLS